MNITINVSADNVLLESAVPYILFQRCAISGRQMMQGIYQALAPPWLERGLTISHVGFSKIGMKIESFHLRLTSIIAMLLTNRQSVYLPLETCDQDECVQDETVMDISIIAHSVNNIPFAQTLPFFPVGM